MAIRQPYISIKNFNFGGVADSKWQGIKDSLARIVGFDLHSVPGLLQVNQKMTKISGTTVTEFCKVVVDGSNNIRYWFSSQSGKIWQEKAGVVTLVYTTSPAAGSAACTGAFEYQGYIYFATQSRLHRIAVASADGSSNWTANVALNWATFTNADSQFHPMREVNLVLYIGDGKYVAQVDAGVFSANALDLASPYRVSSLGQMGTDLLIGTYIADNVNRSKIFRWDTYSTSFLNDDTIPEAGIWCFLESDNYVLVNAGFSGNIYTYNGSQLRFLKRIPGVYSPTKQAKVYPYASAMFFGNLPILAVSNVQGNPCDQGIWSFGKSREGYPNVVNLEFPTSNLDEDDYPILSGIEIGAIVVSGMNLYMSWAYNGTYGIDQLDYTAKQPIAFFETRLIAPDEKMRTVFSEFISNYVSLPEGTEIVMKVAENHSDEFGTTLTGVDNVDSKQVSAPTGRLESKVIQLRIELVSSENDAPTLEEVDIIL